MLLVDERLGRGSCQAKPRAMPGGPLRGPIGGARFRCAEAQGLGESSRWAGKEISFQLARTNWYFFFSAKNFLAKAPFSVVEI